MAFPSWPSLVFLLWACVIWLFPNASPREAVLWTSPFLVLYSTSLLLLQYVYSLDIVEDLDEGFRKPKDIVEECDRGSLEGCKSWVLLAKVGGSIDKEDNVWV